jgi:hypothetical protein
MKHLKTKIRTVLFALFAMIFFYGGSCNIEHIDGYIITESKSINTNDTLILEAILTDEIEPYEVIWEYTPTNPETVLISPFPIDNTESQYKAAFTSENPGEYEISVRFLYKNTSPKNSDSVIIEVINKD